MPAILRMRSFAVLSAMLAAVMLASMFSALTPSADAATRAQRVAQAFDVVRMQKGDPYRYGATGPNAFDCSGLIYYSYRRAGFKVPRTSSQQARHARRVKRRNLRRGDLVFFHNGGRVYHVGVYAGRKNGRRTIVHASRPGVPVKRSPIWTNRWYGGTLR